MAEHRLAPGLAGQGPLLALRRRLVMGMFDTVLVECPVCGENHEAQSKSGPCQLEVTKLEATSQATLQDVNRHAPFTCGFCGAEFRVSLTPTTVLTRIPKP